MLRFYGNFSQEEIAERVGISQMHVSRLLARALSQLRDRLLLDPLPRAPAQPATLLSTARSVQHQSAAAAVTS